MSAIPHQGVLPFAGGIRQTLAARYAEQNEACARIIAADPVKYPGLMQTWATIVLHGNDAPMPAEWRLVA